MSRKIFCIVMVLSMIFASASCGKAETAAETESTTTAEAVVRGVTLPEKKTVIIVGDESIHPEDYNAAKALEAEYPDNVVVKTYSDYGTVKADQRDIISLAEKAASDKTVGAIIFARAIPTTYYAIQRAKEINSGIITVAIEPEEGEVSGCATVVLAADWSRFAADMLENAKAQGMKYFVLAANDRHIGQNPVYAQLAGYLSDNCESYGMKYLNVSFEDSASNGATVASESVKNAINALVDNGTVTADKTAVFSTDVFVQEALVKLANEKGMLYICPAFPGAYDGLCSYYDLDSSVTDTAKFTEALRNAIKADTDGKGKFYIYNYAFMTKLINGATVATFDILSGNKNSEGTNATFIERIKAAADNNSSFTAELYNNGEYIMCYYSAFEYVEKDADASAETASSGTPATTQNEDSGNAKVIIITAVCVLVFAGAVFFVIRKKKSDRQ